MHIGGLTELVLQHITQRSMQNTRAAERQRRGVLTGGV